jgi:hypothetical protein
VHALVGIEGIGIEPAAQPGEALSVVGVERVVEDRKQLGKPAMAETVDRARMLATSAGGSSRAAVRAVIRAGRDQLEK